MNNETVSGHVIPKPVDSQKVKVAYFGSYQARELIAKAVAKRLMDSIDQKLINDVGNTQNNLRHAMAAAREALNKAAEQTARELQTGRML